MTHYLLAIDQGTTNSRAILFDADGHVIHQHEMPLKQSFPHPGWVEQDANEMVDNTVSCIAETLKKSGITANQIAGIGISNQRETTIVWDKNTGEPVYPAIVWQDRRTSDWCQRLSQHPRAKQLIESTGLLIDPYFSASKIAWILDHVPNIRQRAERGELLFGTVDSYLIFRLTHGKKHVTDISNASRTLLFNIHTLTWDKDILALLNIPATMLPAILDNTADFGQTHDSYFGHAIPITGVAGDQQAATVGQACFQPGMMKATYGTGCFIVLNVGQEYMKADHQLLSTIAYRIHDQTNYAIEGSTFSAGTTIKWLRDTVQLIQSTSDIIPLVESIDSTDGVYLVPAFTGLGAPYWDPDARAAILGLSRNSQRAHIVRAAMESVGYQTRDLLEAMSLQQSIPITTLRVDGGMAVNDWLLQFLADILQVTVQRPACVETSALGAAFLAGLQAGVYQSLDELTKLWKVEKTFTPSMTKEKADQLYDGWKAAIQRILTQPITVSSAQ